MSQRDRERIYNGMFFKVTALRKEKSFPPSAFTYHPLCVRFSTMLRIQWRTRHAILCSYSVTDLWGKQTLNKNYKCYEGKEGTSSIRRRGLGVYLSQVCMCICEGGWDRGDQKWLS